MMVNSALATDISSGTAARSTLLVLCKAADSQSSSTSYYLFFALEFQQFIKSFLPPRLSLILRTVADEIQIKLF